MIEQEGIKIESKLVDKKSRITLVTISGYVDQANCHLLQKTIDQCLADECYNLIFDFQHLVYMSSAGWGVLIGEIKRFRENGGDIKLANMGPEIYEIYQMLEFYHIISEYPSVEEALKSFNAFTEMEAFVPLPIETGNDKGVVENERSDSSTESAEDVSERALEEITSEPVDEDETEEVEELVEKSAESFDVEEESPTPGEGEKSPVVIEENIDVNLQELLPEEEMPVPSAPEDSNYVPFDLSRYDRKIDPKIMPIPDKIRAIVAEHPEYTPRKIRKALRSEEYGKVKIGYFKLRSLLKELDLNTKEKRYRFFRSA